MKNPYQKTCPECMETFEANRLNQYYCSMVCKSRFNNRKARALHGVAVIKQEITGAKNQILWKNRQVLRTHVEEEIATDDLLAEGFLLNYITDFYLNKDDDNIL